MMLMRYFVNTMDPTAQARKQVLNGYTSLARFVRFLFCLQPGPGNTGGQKSQGSGEAAWPPPGKRHPT